MLATQRIINMNKIESNNTELKAYREFKEYVADAIQLKLFILFKSSK